MEILLWLVPAAVVTGIAMLWAGWAGRPRSEQTQRSDADQARFARAIVKEHPGARRATGGRGAGLRCRGNIAAQAGGGGGHHVSNEPLAGVHGAGVAQPVAGPVFAQV